MSHAYMRETAEKMKEVGYTLAIEERKYGDEGAMGTLYRLSIAEDKELELETVVHPDVPERYYLALNRWHDLTISSYRLDSWKHFKDRVEFKFDINAATGMGLSFIVRFAEA